MRLQNRKTAWARVWGPHRSKTKHLAFAPSDRPVWPNPPECRGGVLAVPWDWVRVGAGEADGGAVRRVRVRGAYPVQVLVQLVSVSRRPVVPETRCISQRRVIACGRDMQIMRSDEIKNWRLKAWRQPTRMHAMTIRSEKQPHAWPFRTVHQSQERRHGQATFPEIHFRASLLMDVFFRVTAVPDSTHTRFRCSLNPAIARASLVSKVKRVVSPIENV